MEITSLSYSKISSLLRCPKAFEYSYIKQTPVPLNGRMLAGRCYHHALAMAESRKQLFNELISEDEVAKTIVRHWNKELEDKLIYDELGEEKVQAAFVDFRDDDPDELRENTIKLAQLYVQTVLPNLEIVTIEKRMVTKIEGIPFVSYPDLILTNDVIVDHKLTKRKMSEEDLEKDMQATSYALQYGGPVTFQFHQALTTKEKRIEIAETKREQGDIDWFKQIVVDAWKLIQSGIFICNPTGWWCSSDCSFYLDCRKGWF